MSAICDAQQQKTTTTTITIQPPIMSLTVVDLNLFSMLVARAARLDPISDQR